jgi:two-component system sensor histidine kinase/response regulator
MPPPKVLVVDDHPTNVEILKRILEAAGIDTLSAGGGLEALALVSSTPPDLILLDIQMPDLDGITVCQRLHDDETTRHIPVIFVTSESSHQSKMIGLGMGAVDYITKPIHPDETLARVRTQLRLVAINREILDIQHRLDESRRSATIGAMTQGIAHNLNNLLGVALGYLDLLQARPEDPALVKKNAQQVEKAVLRIIDIIRQLGTLVTQSRPQFVRWHLDEILTMTVGRFQTEHAEAPPIHIDNPLQQMAMETNREILEDVLINLFNNAWESYGNAPAAERSLWVRTAILNKLDGPMIEITIEDAGQGISESIRHSIFEPFVGTKTKVGGGMGLTVARHSMRNLGGEVSLSNRVGGGTVAAITHPLVRKKKRGPGGAGGASCSLLIGEHTTE